MSRPPVSVILPARNAASTIDGQLRALSRQTYSGAWELIVVDNGSRDGTSERVRGWSARLPGLRIVDARAGVGVGYARNAGAAAASGAILAYCDADDEATPEWLAELAGGAARHDIVGGPALWFGGRTRQRGQALDSLPDHLDFLPWAYGCNFAVRASVLSALGGWDESSLAEDIELCWRAQLAGHSIGFAEGAVMRYRVRPGMRAAAFQHWRFGLMIARVCRRYRAHGARLPRRDVRESLPALLRLHDLRDGEARDDWARAVALRAGGLAGMLSPGERSGLALKPALRQAARG